MAVEDYVEVKVKIAGITERQDSTHYMYMRQNMTKFPLVNDQRTVFISNLPVDSTEAHLKALFAQMGGRTESITFHTIQDSSRHLEPEDMPMELDEIQDEAFSKELKRLKRLASLPRMWTRNLLPSGCNAHVKFIDSEEMRTVMKTARKDLPPLRWGEGIIQDRVPPLGKDRYRSHLATRFPSPEALQESVDAFMELFNKEELLKKRKQKLVRSVPDEEGFVTITRGGRSGAGRTADALKLAERAKTKGIASDLYRFQRKDEHKAKMVDLRMKFEDDKRKIAELKARRRFQG